MKNIAFISTIPPSLESGAESRNFYLLQILAQRYSVRSIIPRFSDKFPINQHGELPLIKRLFYLLLMKIPYIERLKNATLSEKEYQLLQNADVIQLQEMTAYYFFEKYIPKLGKKIILDTHNVDYVRFIAEIEKKNFIEKFIGYLLANKLKQLEINAAKTVDHIIVCSEKEKEYFSHYVSPEKISVIPNAVDCKKFQPVTKSANKTIFFMGLLSYPPNQEGLKYYIKRIHPLVTKQIPDAIFTIVGKGAPAWLSQLIKNDASIHFTGFVPDVRDYIKKAQVCICPVLSGSGTRLKILEYMAMGKAVISTSRGAEGIQIKNGRDILLADNNKLFAQLIIDLLKNNERCVYLGSNARKLIEKEYDWENVGKKLISVYKNLSL